MNYYSLNKYLKNTFGEKVYKISLNGNMTCPNRDGTLGGLEVTLTLPHIIRNTFGFASPADKGR